MRLERRRCVPGLLVSSRCGGCALWSMRSAADTTVDFRACDTIKETQQNTSHIVPMLTLCDDRSQSQPWPPPPRPAHGLEPSPIPNRCARTGQAPHRPTNRPSSYTRVSTRIWRFVENGVGRDSVHAALPAFFFPGGRHTSML